MVSTGPVIRRRLAICLISFVCLFAMLTVRLFQLQVIRAEELQLRAQSQWTSESVVAPQRGTIFDRNGHELAISATAYIASVSPRQVDDPKAFAQILAPILDMDAEVIEKRASDRSKGGVTLKRQLTREKAQQLREMFLEHQQRSSKALNGLYIEEDSRRFYPMGAFASQLIGLTTIDGVGQSGLEQSLNKYLSGKAGKVLDEIDGKGRELSYGAKEYVPPVDGSDVTLTIDLSIQSFVEQAAREAMTVNGAKAVRILAMNPKTGEILALCNKPDFDLNDPPRDDVDTLNELMRNRLITDAYEPGSTFKILTSSAALESKVVSVSEGFYCSGSVVVDGGRIRCWGNPHGAESFAQAIQNSCNPVFVEMGLRLGVERFYTYLRGFGLGTPTGVDIPGEASGILISEENCKRVDIARIGFGQSVALTPIQLLTAVSAVVNGGNLITPYVVQEIATREGEILEQGKTVIRGNPISGETSAVMRSLLEDVVEYGGGKNAFIKGFHIGGKTGTAQVYVDGVVSSDTHIGSFVGFAPADDPEIAVLVIIDEATKRPDFGSVTAAPFARDILEKSLHYLGVALDEEIVGTINYMTVPDVMDCGVSDAIAAVKEAGFTPLISGTGSHVIDQMPAGGAEMAENSLVMLYVEGETDSAPDARVEVPDLSGLSITEANRRLQSYGLTLRIQGTGVAVSQSPQPGESVTPTTRVEVIFEPPAVNGVQVENEGDVADLNSQGLADE